MSDVVPGVRATISEDIFIKNDKLVHEYLQQQN